MKFIKPPKKIADLIAKDPIGYIKSIPGHPFADIPNITYSEDNKSVTYNNPRSGDTGTTFQIVCADGSVQLERLLQIILMERLFPELAHHYTFERRTAGGEYTDLSATFCQSNDDLDVNHFIEFKQSSRTYGSQRAFTKNSNDHFNKQILPYATDTLDGLDAGGIMTSLVHFNGVNLIFFPKALDLYMMADDQSRRVGGWELYQEYPIYVESRIVETKDNKVTFREDCATVGLTNVVNYHRKVVRNGFNLEIANIVYVKDAHRISKFSNMPNGLSNSREFAGIATPEMKKTVLDFIDTIIDGYINEEPEILSVNGHYKVLVYVKNCTLYSSENEAKLYSTEGMLKEGAEIDVSLVSLLMALVDGQHSSLICNLIHAVLESHAAGKSVDTEYDFIIDYIEEAKNNPHPRVSKNKNIFTSLKVFLDTAYIRIRTESKKTIESARKCALNLNSNRQLSKAERETALNLSAVEQTCFYTMKNLDTPVAVPHKINKATLNANHWGNQMLNIYEIGHANALLTSNAIAEDRKEVLRQMLNDAKNCNTDSQKATATKQFILDFFEHSIADENDNSTITTLQATLKAYKQAEREVVRATRSQKGFANVPEARAYLESIDDGDYKQRIDDIETVKQQIEDTKTYAIAYGTTRVSLIEEECSKLSFVTRTLQNLNAVMDAREVEAKKALDAMTDDEKKCADDEKKVTKFFDRSESVKSFALVVLREKFAGSFCYDDDGISIDEIKHTLNMIDDVKYIFDRTYSGSKDLNITGVRNNGCVDLDQYDDLRFRNIETGELDSFSTIQMTILDMLKTVYELEELEEAA